MNSLAPAPASSAAPSAQSASDPIGFKDWASVCDAMLQGRQSIILRKGGLAEGRDGFQFKHRDFFLFPTAYHEQLARLRPEESDSLANAASALRENGIVEVSGAFRLEWAAVVTEWEAAHALAPFHLYREEVVRERFVYDGNPGLQVAFGRAWKLATPWTFDDEPRFGGCRSWVKLPRTDAPALPGSDSSQLIPALSDADHTALASQLDEWRIRFGITTQPLS